MTVHLHMKAWIAMSMLSLAARTLTAQCTPPAALWLHNTQTSTSFNINWTAVNGATQYQIRYWENAAPDDKTIVENVGPAPLTLSGLKKSTLYSIQLRSACGNAIAAWGTPTNYLTGPNSGVCEVPTGVSASVSAANIVVNWTSSGSHTIRYRSGDAGDWTIPSGGLSVSNAPFVITGLPPGTYNIEVKHNCSGSTSNYVGASISTEISGSCLSNKNFGKNLSAQELLEISANYNSPSPFTFGDMIGVNDGGLVFRSFQNSNNNQITRLTTQYRNFHTIDEDFDSSIGNYAQNVKPKDTYPEGTPSNTAHNKGYYQLYRNTHGFTQITGAIELLHYGPQSWKDKIYLESDWSSAGPSGIRQSFGNYTKKFIDEFAPANGTDDQILVSNFQVGNELWDYPVKSDYHNLLAGARDAFIYKYGEKSAGGWKMTLEAGAFQAFRDNNCSSTLRDVSNCEGSLLRHDFIGDYLDVTNCDILKDLDAIDCHPYSFIPGTTTWTYPENPQSESWQIRNLAGWLDTNKNSDSGVLNNARLWSTEYGFDSNTSTGVGELTQSAYLIRGLFMHSRYHFEKVFFYNAYDQARTGDAAYSGLYYSSGFWRLGTHPGNNAWPSPLPEHGATAKPSWYSMLDLKSRFGQHVFYKALVEDSEADIWLIAKPDGTDPYLVFWAPQQTTDANVDQDIAVVKTVNWAGVLTGNYRMETGTGQTFAGSDAPGQTFNAASGSECGVSTFSTIRRNPAYIRLLPCSNCDNITNPGSIVEPTPSSGASPFNPDIISNDFEASGGSSGAIEYQWQKSSFNNSFTDIQGAQSVSYDPPSLLQSTYFRRAAKRSACTDYLYSPSVIISVISACPNIVSFLRYNNTSAGCHVGSDYYYEIVLNNVTTSDQITLAGLPLNGLSISLSSLNGNNFTTQAFFANLQYVNSSSSIWLVTPSNGSTQTLRLYYCWANAYPTPVSISTATSQCSGISKSCAAGTNFSDSGSEERNSNLTFPPMKAFGFKVQPNPGSDQFWLTYLGKPAAQATLRVFNATSQLVYTLQITDVKDQQQWQLSTADLPAGLYYLCLQIDDEMMYELWGKL